MQKTCAGNVCHQAVRCAQGELSGWKSARCRKIPTWAWEFFDGVSYSVCGGDFTNNLSQLFLNFCTKRRIMNSARTFSLKTTTAKVSGVVISWIGKWCQCKFPFSVRLQPFCPRLSSTLRNRTCLENSNIEWDNGATTITTPTWPTPNPPDLAN